MNDLNPAQREAVRHIDGPLLVLAGAGSGKTRVITRKIAWLIEACGLSPRHICAVTFTNKAAREMRERVGRLLPQGARGLRVSTFHALGLEIIRRETAAAGRRPGFSIFDADDSAGVVRDLLRQEHGEVDRGLIESVRSRLSSWKNALLDPVSAAEVVDGPIDQLALALFGEYEAHLAAFNAVDFDDLITLPVRLLERDPALLERWQGQIRYLLVDEYQDTNLCQYRLVRLLVGVRGALTAVGDDDQSIYSWRGARPDNLARLADDFPRLKVVKLEQNYRSTGRILRCANALIAHNPHLFEKRLWSEVGHGDPVRVLACNDAEHEAQKVASEILHHRFVHRTPLRDFAILYRGNHQSRLFEKALREHELAYRISGGSSFFAASEVKDIAAYLRLLVNPDDDAAFLRIVNTPRREIGRTTVERLTAWARQRGLGLRRVCTELGLAGEIGERAAARLADFAHWLDGLERRAADQPAAAVARAVVEESGYAVWLEAQCGDSARAARRMENVEELIGWMERAAERDEEARSLANALSRLALLDLLDRNQEEEGDAITLATLHAAKGLEFPHVFLVGFEEELLPHHASLEETALEEERRLAYVGITRAQRSLTLTWARRRKRAGELVECTPSRFLDELPGDELQREGGGEPVDEARSRERGRAHLAHLKAMLKK